MATKIDNSKKKLVRLLSENGKILYKNGFVDLVKGVYDESGQIYPAGFDSDGMAYGTNGEIETGQIIFEDGKDTGYNINTNYFPLVCMRVVHRNFNNTAQLNKIYNYGL